MISLVISHKHLVLVSAVFFEIHLTEPRRRERGKHPQLILAVVIKRQPVFCRVLNDRIIIRRPAHCPALMLPSDAYEDMLIGRTVYLLNRIIAPRRGLGKNSRHQIS